MMNFLILLMLSVLISFGMSIAIVEKGDKYPIRYFKLRFKLLLHDYISWKFAQVLDCTTCISFWISLIVDICLCFIGFFCFGIPYFFWPLSGFITLGFSWFIIEFLNALDKKQNIINNNYIFEGKNENTE